MATHCYVLLLLFLVIFCSSLVAATPCYKVTWDGKPNENQIFGCQHSRGAINFIYVDETPPEKALNKGFWYVECCQWDAIYNESEPVFFKADWKHLLERQNQWVRCPPGFFLEGLNGARSNEGYLQTIDSGHCVKPSSHPYRYEKCIDKDFEPKDQSRQGICDNGYFITGFFRNSCQKPSCLDKVRCCKMSVKQIEMESLDTVKIKIMEETLVDISYLAHYLGYDNAGGCRSGMVGQDFLRYGDTWEAVKGDKCVDYKGDHVFSIEYGDWKFSVKDIAYSNPIIDNLNPETIDLATIYNKDNINSSHLIRRTERSITTVTHTKTSQWSISHEAGIESSIGVNFLLVSASQNLHYTFNYASGKTQEASESNEQWKTFEVESSKVIPPNSAVKWYLKLFKSRTTVSYTATILVHFSVRLRGFLREGEYYSNSTNYNYNYRGLTWRDHNYTFGGSSEPFYTSLKRESERNSKPWMWNEMQDNYNYRPQDIINNLINEKNYVFTLTGKFEAVSGSNVEIIWEDMVTGNETNNTSASGKKENGDKCFLCGFLGKEEKRDVVRSRRVYLGDTDLDSGGNTRNIAIIYPDEENLKNFAEVLPGDPPPVFPPPPQVNITKTPKKERERLTIMGN